jgi:probable HAF family extracellular repeat protein
MWVLLKHPLQRESLAYSINDAGLVVGTSVLADFETHATLWIDGISIDLGGPKSYSYDINNADEIVGRGTYDWGSSYAAIWSGGTQLNLNTLLDASGAGWALGIAIAMNDFGMIVGTGRNGLGQTRAFLLTPCEECIPIPCESWVNPTPPSPVPVPAALPLFASGVGGLGFFGLWRRCKKLGSSA